MIPVAILDIVRTPAAKILGVIAMIFAIFIAGCIHGEGNVTAKWNDEKHSRNGYWLAALVRKTARSMAIVEERSRRNKVIYLLIASVLLIIVGIAIGLAIPEHGGDGYLGQGTLAALVTIAGVALLAVTFIWWLASHLSWL